VSSKNDRSISGLKDHHMRNKFDHKHFDAFINSKPGKEYWMGMNTKSEEQEKAQGVVRKSLDPDNQDDLLLPLAAKHYDRLQMNAIKYWERKNVK
jgi:hypothetical protein